MRIDYEYGHRMALLVELMEQFPDGVMKKLQYEALKYYPVQSQELIRRWMSSNTALKAADIVNHKILKDDGFCTKCWRDFDSYGQCDCFEA